MLDTNTVLKALQILIQSSLSMSPPWPGSVVAKSLIPTARLNPEAKKPKNGAMMDAKRA